MKTPSFRHMGGKARLRRWLLDNFPKSGSYYVEPFAGKGNVFYLSYPNTYYKYYLLNDKFTYPFLNAVKNIDVSKLPDIVDRRIFSELKASDSDLSLVVEPRITFAGKGYKYGFSGSSGTHVGYSKYCYSKTVESAKELLNEHNVSISDKDWRHLHLNKLPEDAFIYFDPPYLGTNNSYPNIDHDFFLTYLDSLRCRWAVSGYDKDLYLNLCSKRKIQYTRNSEIKSSNHGAMQPVVETLWTNY